MSPTRKFSACLVAISMSCVCLLFVFSSSVWPQEAKKANPRIKELQQKRLAVLEEIRDSAKKLFTQGVLSFEDVFETQREVLAARLEYADTRKERIKVCDEAIQEAAKWQELVKAQREAAQVTIVPVLKADAYLLEVQIAREKAEVAD